jgi:sulfate transport system permease protein
VVIVVGLPLGVLVSEALGVGVARVWRVLSAPDTQSALRLTLLTSIAALPPTVLFGIAAAWAVAKCEFPGRSLLVAIIDLPFAMSPVVAGMLVVLLLGRSGPLGPTLDALGVQLLYTPVAMVVAIMLVTLPFVARELIPIMRAQGTEEELVALSLGASGFQTLLRVTLPNIKWALLHGVLLAWARAIGDFGAVSIVSGRIEGATMTLPLHVEALHAEYRFGDAFVVASMLVALSLALAALKYWLGRRLDADRTQPEREGAHVH